MPFSWNNLDVGRISGLFRFTLSHFGKGRFLLRVVGFVLATSIYGTGVRLESKDSFCASCHVEPESTYYQSSLMSTEATTLAVFHAEKQTRCIDCHSRRWIPGRLWAHWGGVQNLLAFRSGHYRSPAETTRPVGDSGCTKCHNDLTWVAERPGHYHSPGLRKRWRSAGGPANTCEACHPAHQQSTLEFDFMDADRIEIQCDACHDTTGS